jgi:transposase
VASEQTGATAHRLGRRLVAAGHLLHYGIGVPVRQVPQVLRLLCGVTVTQSALTQDALRRAAGPVGEAYRTLREGLARAPSVNTDDTGWSVGGENAWLMTFTTEDTAVYQVRRRHRNEEVREVLPADYAGVLCSDRGKSYDAQELAGVRQQKCLAHILRNLAEILQRKRLRSRWFAAKLQELLRAALALWHRWHAGEREGFEAARAVLVRRVTEHLRDRRLRDRDNQRLLDELGWHHDRSNLLRFLFELHVEPTNNRAERALRGAVIARKVSQCNKNTAGAEAFGAFTSVVKTLVRRCPEQALEALVEVFATGQIPTPAPYR